MERIERFTAPIPQSPTVSIPQAVPARRQVPVREVVTSALELAGAVAVLVAAFAADWRAGLAVLGVLLVVVGWVLSR